MARLHRLGLQPHRALHLSGRDRPCGVYWREIDAHLDIEVCAPPRIVAEKPFAVPPGYVVEFDLDTGRFEDFTPSFSDRGRCEAIDAPAD